MGELIDALLVLSRVTRADLRRLPLNLSALAEAIAAELRQREPERAAEFTIAPDLHTEGDPTLVRTVLENLLGNAWKFTAACSPARIEVGSRDDPADGRVFFVRDNGAGFDMTYADRLFGAFQRLHDQREFKGTGIGLASVQRIIVRHGGRVWGEGQVGGGATFYFTLS
jgi:light-regulated signal transduction histidine kinase (bacteriophytochrome)